MDDIILVDNRDLQTGTGEKMPVHQSGLLHRAFSVCIYNSKGEQLLQKRATIKYHCPGLWSNACCSHPKPGEALYDAAKRRLKEEMGIDYDWSGRNADVPQMEFIYKVKVGELIEHEYDHVLFAACDNDPVINQGEADDYKWVGREDLVADIRNNPKAYTPWFRLMMKVAWHGNDPKSLVPELEEYVEKTKFAKI